MGLGAFILLIVAFASSSVASACSGSAYHKQNASVRRVKSNLVDAARVRAKINCAQFNGSRRN